MKVIFSDHAKKQLNERQISEEAVVETVKNPEEKSASFRNRQLLQKRFGDKILEVVVVKENQNLTVITQYFLKEH